MKEEITKKHEALIYPMVRVRTEKAGGSGTLIYSYPNKDGDYETYLLTNFHVVENAVRQEKQWSPLLQRDVKKDILSEVTIEQFDFEYESWEPTTRGYNGEIQIYDKNMDIALVKIKSSKRFPYVAKLFPKGEEKKRIRLFMPVYAVGCGLGHPTFQTRGELAAFNDIIDNYPYWMSTAPTIFGNCLPGDTLISMANGSVKEIKDIQAGDRVWSFGTSGLVQRTVQERINSGEKDIYEIKTRTRKVRASGNHPLLVLKTKKDWVGRLNNFVTWAPVENLHKGDVIAVMDQLPDRYRVDGFRFHDYVPQGKSIEDFLKLIGFFLGDGWVRKREGISYELSFAVYNNELKEKYASILKDLFNVDVLGDKDMIRVYNKDLVLMFDKLGLNKKSSEKEIPHFVMTAPHYLQRAFIEGYIDSDGYINKLGDWVFEANNKKLINQLRMMLIHQGFNVSNIHKRTRKSTEIRGRIATPSGPSYSFQAYPSYSKNKSCYIEGNIDALPKGLSYERISSLEYVGKEQTYDLKIEGTHNFFANGVLVHNSGGAVFLADTFEYIGIPSRISVMMIGFGGDAITHMSYFIPITSIYKFLEDNMFQFIYDSNYTSEQCAKMRKEKRERDEKRMAIDVSREEAGND